MTGHFVYTRSSYAHDSSVKNEGTWITELTDNIFGQESYNIINNRLIPLLSQVQESTSGTSLDSSQLSIFHPSHTTTIVKRSYYINDDITRRGHAPYSFGLIFTGQTRNALLTSPLHAFSYDAYEPYHEFVSRVPQDRPAIYSDAYDPKPKDYQQTLVLEHNFWTKMGFNESLFSDFITSLTKAISSHGEKHKVGVVLPEGVKGEEVILAAMSILPVWLKFKFGATSRFAGAIEGSASATGMHLFCYSGSNPPPNNMKNPTINIVDKRSSNVVGLSNEERAFARWSWQNVGNLAALQHLETYMTETFGGSLDKMPYEAFMQCFWIWLTFREEKGDSLDIKASGHALYFLAKSFGKNISHFKDDFILNKIVETYTTNIETNLAGDNQLRLLDTNAVEALNFFGQNGITLGTKGAAELLRETAFQLAEKNMWRELEIILPFCKKDFLEGNLDDKDVRRYEEVFKESLGSGQKNMADFAAEVFRQHGDKLVNAILVGGKKDTTNEQAIFSQILENLLAKDYEYEPSVFSAEYAIRDDREAVNFYLLEGIIRVHNKVNKKPPTPAQFKRVVREVLERLKILDLTNFKQEELDLMSKIEGKILLGVYWNAEILKDKSTRYEYIMDLGKAGVLTYFADGDVGLEDIFEAYKQNLLESARKIEYLDAKDKTEWLESKIKEIQKETNFSEDTPPIRTAIERALAWMRTPDPDGAIENLTTWHSFLSEHSGPNHKSKDLDAVVSMAEAYVRKITDQQISSAEKAKRIIAWNDFFARTCGLDDDHKTFGVLRSASAEMGFNDENFVLQTLEPKGIFGVAKLMSLDGILSARKTIEAIDAQGVTEAQMAGSGRFYRTNALWHDNPVVATMRLKYWSKATNPVSSELAFCRAVLKTNLDNTPNSIAIDYLRFFEGELNRLETLKKLYDFLELARQRYTNDIPYTAVLIFKDAIKSNIGNLSEEKETDILRGTANDFKRLATIVGRSDKELSRLGTDIERIIEQAVRARQLSADIGEELKAIFSPSSRSARQTGAPVSSQDGVFPLLLSLVTFVGVFSMVALFFTSDGLSKALEAVLPLWVIIAMPILLLVSVLILIVGLGRRSA